MKSRRVSRARLIVIVLGMVFGGLLLPEAASATSVGAGVWSQPWLDAYGRAGGSAAIGYAENNVHTWNNGCLQDFGGGKYVDAALMSPGCQSGRVYSVINSRWWYVARVNSH